MRTHPQPLGHDTSLPPEQAAQLRHHPRWCDRQQCITSDNGIRHTSTPTHLMTGEQIFALILIQHDPGGEPELLIEVTDTGDPDGLHLLTLPEIKAFAETLLIEYLKAAPLATTAPAHRPTPDEALLPSVSSAGAGVSWARWGWIAREVSTPGRGERR